MEHSDLCSNRNSSRISLEAAFPGPASDFDNGYMWLGSIPQCCKRFVEAREGMAMADKKETGFDLARYQNLLGLLEDLNSSIVKFNNALNVPYGWDNLIHVAGEIRSWIRSVKDSWTSDLDKATLTKLEQSGLFLEKYSKEKNPGMVRSNFASMKGNFRKVKEEVIRMARSHCYSELLPELKVIENPSSKSYLEEACNCYSLGAFRSSVVMAGCALEEEVRRIYDETFGKSKGRIAFANAIEALEKKGKLPADQGAIVSICKTFRNFTAHPSEFKTSHNEAKSIIQLAFEQLKKGGNP